MRVDAIVPGGHLSYSLVVRLGGSGSKSDAIAMNANVNQLQVCRCSSRSEDRIDYLPLLPHLCLRGGPPGKIKGHGSLRDKFGVSWRIYRRLGPRTQRARKGYNFQNKADSMH